MAISQNPASPLSLKPHISSSSKPVFRSLLSSVSPRTKTLRAATMSGLSRLRPLGPRLLSVRCLSIRSYGSPAAQLQYDSDYYDEEEQQQLQQHGVVGTEGSVPGRGVKWVLIGHRGVQRRVYAEKLLEVPHISMGSLVRQELHPSSSLYKQIANAVNEGKLVPEEIIFTLLSRRLEEGYCRGETGFILDGIPRTRMQAEILNQIAHIDLVVNFKCTEYHLVKNNLGAGNFSPCRKYLSMSNAGCNLNLMFQNKQLKTSPTDIGGSWRESFIFIQSRVRHWKITIGNSRDFLIFMWQVHQEKPGLELGRLKGWAASS